MTNIQRVRVHVNLAPDVNGVAPRAGQEIDVDLDSPGIMGHVMAGYLVPLEPLDFPAALQPPTGQDPQEGTQEATTAPSGENQGNPPRETDGAEKGSEGPALTVATGEIGAAPVEESTPFTATPVEDAIAAASAAHAELEAMTKAELISQFAPEGVTESNTKAEIIAAIEAQAD